DTRAACRVLPRSCRCSPPVRSSATPNVGVARAQPGLLAAAFPGVLMFAADGFMAAGFYFVWQIALFVALGESYTAYGGAVALAALVGAARGPAARPLPLR